MVLRSGLEPQMRPFHGGLFWYYVESSSGKDYELFDRNLGGQEEKATLWLCVSQVVLAALLSVIAPCCMRGGGEGGWQPCLGFLTFVVGILGIAGTILKSTTSTLWTVTVSEAEDDWALYVYAAGSSVLTVSAFVLCCCGETHVRGWVKVPGSKSLTRGYIRS